MGTFAITRDAHGSFAGKGGSGLKLFGGGRLHRSPQRYRGLVNSIFSREGWQRSDVALKRVVSFRDFAIRGCYARE